MNVGLEPYISEWGISELEHLSSTRTSDVYKVRVSERPAVLKVLSETGKEDESNAPSALVWFDGEGAVRLLRADAGAMLLEYADGDTLTEMVRSGQDDEATRIIAAVLNRLHKDAPGEPPSGLTPLRNRFSALLDSEELGDHEILRSGAAVADRLLSDNRPAHVLHGDMHHENVRYQRERGWLALDPKGLTGERVYDAVNALCNPHGLPAIVQRRDRLLRQAGIMAKSLNVDRDRLLAYAFAHACLSAVWFIEDGQDPRDAFAIAEVARDCFSRAA